MRTLFYRGRHRLPCGRHRIGNPFGVLVEEIRARLFCEWGFA